MVRTVKYATKTGLRSSVIGDSYRLETSGGIGITFFAPRSRGINIGHQNIVTIHAITANANSLQVFVISNLPRIIDGSIASHITVCSKAERSKQ